MIIIHHLCRIGNSSWLSIQGIYQLLDSHDAVEGPSSFSNKHECICFPQFLAQNSAMSGTGNLTMHVTRNNVMSQRCRPCPGGSVLTAGRESGQPDCDLGSLPPGTSAGMPQLRLPCWTCPRLGKAPGGQPAHPSGPTKSARSVSPSPANSTSPRMLPEHSKSPPWHACVW